MDLWTFEEAAWNAGKHGVCGVDEAGAGPLAGPVYAAAVILPPRLYIDGLDDSKKLTEKKREKLFDVIREQAVAFSVAWVEAEEIDRINILNARMKAMQLAIDGLTSTTDFALIDGNRDHGTQYAIATPHELVVRGDGRSASIAAASILAKVSRDHFVCDTMARDYPQYGFSQHKGYGTKFHYQMLDRFGPTPVHRKTFLKKWEQSRP